MQLQALAMGLNCRVNSSLLCKQTEQHKSAVVVALAALKAQVTAEYQGGEGLLLAFLGLAYGRPLWGCSLCSVCSSQCRWNSRPSAGDGRCW